MKYILMTLCLAALPLLLAPQSANALVCARGVVRAGCVSARGAVVVHRPVAVRPVVRRRVVR